MQMGQLAVIGVLIVEGAHNAVFDPIWAAADGDLTN
jgi:hypothetical protein